MGKWGYINQNGNTMGFNYMHTNPTTNREQTTTFIQDSIKVHFTPRGSGQFPSPPNNSVPLVSKWTTAFTWTICDQEGNTTSCNQRKVVYAPGRGPKTKVNINSKQKQPTTLPVAQLLVNPPSEQPWKTIQGGSAAKQSFAQAAAAVNKTKVTGPQRKYGNIPTNRFMAPPPKVVPKHTGSYGKRYMLKYSWNKKPTEGTKLPIQVIVSEINKTCTQLNIKANSAEWTTALNLQIFFMHNSLDSQIEKARTTILGVLAKGCPKAIFMKSVKWSHVVIRDVPITRWTNSEDGMVKKTLACHMVFS